MRRKLAAGNWKMNGNRQSVAVLDDLANSRPDPAAEVVICPPAPLIPLMTGRAGYAIGGQDCHAAASGAHTGDLAAEMLADAGASHVIVGHSERRTDHGEGDADIHAKAEAAWRAGLVAIICIGETEGHRDSDQTLDVLGGQLAGSVPDAATAQNTVIAYEPVWAIGTGLVPSTDQIAEAHAHIRSQLTDKEIAILYGGSVKGSNAADIFAVPNVDGALVGGASLKAADFSTIISALEAS